KSNRTVVIHEICVNDFPAVDGERKLPAGFLGKGVCRGYGNVVVGPAILQDFDIDDWSNKANPFNSQLITEEYFSKVDDDFESFRSEKNFALERLTVYDAEIFHLNRYVRKVAEECEAEIVGVQNNIGINRLGEFSIHRFADIILENHGDDESGQENDEEKTAQNDQGPFQSFVHGLATKVNDTKLATCGLKHFVSPGDLPELSVEQRHKLCQKAVLSRGMGRIQQGRCGQSMPLSDNRFLVRKGHKPCLAVCLSEAASSHTTERKTGMKELHGAVVDANTPGRRRCQEPFDFAAGIGKNIQRERFRTMADDRFCLLQIANRYYRKDGAKNLFLHYGGVLVNLFQHNGMEVKVARMVCSLQGDDGTFLPGCVK